MFGSHDVFFKTEGVLCRVGQLGLLRKKEEA
jgi:hypothetical protein